MTLENKNSNLSRWRELATNFLGEDFFNELPTALGRNTPRADVYQSKDEVIVLIDLPGIEDVNSVEIKIDGKTLVVKGKYSNPYKNLKAAIVERNRGDFKKIIPLGSNVSKRYNSATYKKGVLEIRFPKIKDISGEKININNL